MTPMERDKMTNPKPAPTVAIIGAGPAGLMAAEILSKAGLAVTVYDRMASVGRKFLMAGRGGLNLTHSEDLQKLLGRFGSAAARLTPAIKAFPPDALKDWAENLGQPTFVGSSGRIFPVALKASPLLRAWLGRLQEQGVRFQLRRNWRGWNEAGALKFRLADDTIETIAPDATILALGGASWPRLGSNGAWVDILTPQGIDVAHLLPSNCGFKVKWSETFKSRFEGQPLKSVAISFNGQTVRGDVVVTGYGLEGGAIYALTPTLRDTIAKHGRATILIDLQPGLDVAKLASRLEKPQGTGTLTNHLRKVSGLSPIAINLMREGAGAALPRGARQLAALIKATPVTLKGIQPLERAISTAGGVRFGQLDESYMVMSRPGLFMAGEMLDWEAPTGGYLLQAVFATGVAAANGVLSWLESQSAA